MVGKLSPGQNGKVFGQAFFKKLAGRGVPVAHELAPTEPAGEKRRAGGTRMSAGLISRFGRCFLFATGKPHPSRQARLRGRRPLLFCALRNAKQKKTVPAKNSEANFWRPRFTWPLRAGKRANANFACSEGFFLSGVPRHMAGWPFLRRPAAVMLAFVPGACFPVLHCSRGFSPLFSPFPA